MRMKDKERTQLVPPILQKLQ